MGARTHGRAAAVLVAMLLPGACGAGTELPTGPTAPSRATTLADAPSATMGTTSTTQAPTTTEPRPPELSPPAPPLPPAALLGPDGPLPRSVYVLGDSVILGAQQEVRQALGSWEVVVDAQESRLVNQGIGVLRARREEADRRASEAYEQAHALAILAGVEPPPPPRPTTYAEVVGPVVVVSLCTNYSTGGGFASFIDAYMAELSSVPRVVWVTCGEWSPGQIEANAAIRDAPGRHPRAVVADWAPHGAWPTYTYDDGIHLNAEGRQVMAQVVSRAVGALPG